MKRKELFSKFDALLLKALIVVLILSLLLGMGVRYYLVQYVNRECKERLEYAMLGFENMVQEDEKESNKEALWRIIRYKLGTTGLFNVYWESGIDLDSGSGCWDMVSFNLLDSDYTDGCAGGAVLLDQKGQVVSSNRKMLVLYIDGDHDESWGDRLYLCDPAELQIPELDQVFYGIANSDNFITAELISAYVNEETHSFVPCTGCLYGGRRTLVNLHVDLPGYELLSFEPQQLQPGTPVNPNESGKQIHFWGESQAVLDELAQIKPYTFGSELQSPIIQYVELPDDYAVYEGITQVQIFGEPYWLNVRYKLNYNADTIRRCYVITASLFALICAVIAVIICKRRKWQEKAARESFRIGLTDSLAHDVKTPLMAISGYTENVLSGKLSEAEEQEYLHSILDNVAYTDDLISRTLYLNHMEQGKKGTPETLRLAALAEKLLTKYDLMLREKHIRAGVSGSAEIQADPAALETILENLISNAVKYTPEDGKIEIEMDKKRLTVTNSVAQKISVKKLKEPFVRGDAARSNVKGNGLGLAIADRTADANGFKLKLSCTEHAFKAELKF